MKTLKTKFTTMIVVGLICGLAGISGCKDQAKTNLEKVECELQISIYITGYKQGRLDQMQRDTENRIKEDCLMAAINFINLMGMDTTYYEYARKNSR